MYPKIIQSAICWLCVLLTSFAVTARAQAPAAISGDSFLIQVTSGTAPFAGTGYYLFVPANSGNAYQIINIYNITGSSGTYAYSPTNTTGAEIAFSDSVIGTGLIDMDFLGNTYILSGDAYPGSYQAGEFQFANYNAPTSIAGKTFLLDGTESIHLAGSGNSYSSSSGTSGTYSYSLVNRCTGKLQINDVLLGTFTAYFGFKDSLTGGYAATATGQYRIGTFRLVDTNPPTVSVITPSIGQRWSNQVFTASGKASDNIQVSAVYYQVAGDDWNLATTTNAWTNWFGTVTLPKPGTNQIRAYGIDSSGNTSAIVTIPITYVLTAPIAIRTNGGGSISPIHDGDMLELGKGYSATALAANGFKFINWTGSVQSSNATLNFVMASNLAIVANFADVTRPTVSVTNLVSGKRWFSQTFSIGGTATDNSRVARVQYCLNDGLLRDAVGTTVWNASLPLIPGTNVFTVFAEDAAGNRSATNTYMLQYVVTNLLAIRATGLGAVSPNYSNAWLEIGRNYTMTATPASGFILTNWTIGTNWNGGYMTNNATVPFTMASNLTLRVAFADISRPAVSVSSPVSGRRMTNALAAVVGTATDNWKISGVWCQVNGGAWTLANSTNGFTNWLRTMTLVGGTNTIKAYAVDLAGNVSATNMVSVVSSNTFNLLLSITNLGAVPNAGARIRVGSSGGFNGVVQTSTNLIDWETLTNFAGTNTSFNFNDSDAANRNSRFFRAIVP